MENNTIVKTKGLSKTFEMGGSKVHSLSGVSLVVKKGEFVTIMGPSGSGKTSISRPREKFIWGERALMLLTCQTPHSTRYGGTTWASSSRVSI